MASVHVYISCVYTVGLLTLLLTLLVGRQEGIQPVKVYCHINSQKFTFGTGTIT